MDFTRREITKYGSMFYLSTMLGLTKTIKADDLGKREFEIFPGGHKPYQLYFSDQVSLPAGAGAPAREGSFRMPTPKKVPELCGANFKFYNTYGLTG